MKHNTITKGLLGAFVLALACTLSIMPGQVSADNSGHAWGHYKKNHDGAMFGRSHSPYYNKSYAAQYRYSWDGKTFDDFDEFVSYLRDWFEENRNGGWQDSDDADIDIETESATDIDDDTATLEGTIDFTDSDSATVWFEYGPGTDLRWRTTKVRLTEGSGEEDFGRTLLGLEEGQKYSFRAVGQDEDGDIERGSILTFTTDGTSGSSDDDEPTLTTLSATGIDFDEATLRGEVDMNDFNNGTVFIVYGESRSEVEDVGDEYETYDDIDENGDNLQKVLLDSDLDDDASYSFEVDGLDSDETIYFAIGVSYEDDDGDEVISLGSVRSFTTE